MMIGEIQIDGSQGLCLAEMSYSQLIQARRVALALADKALQFSYGKMPRAEDEAEDGEPTIEDHSDDVCPCGDIDCNRPFGHPEED